VEVGSGESLELLENRVEEIKMLKLLFLWITDGAEVYTQLKVEDLQSLQLLEKLF
jgi:hypothetical protein